MDLSKAYLNEYAININEFNICPERISDLVKLIQEGKVSNSVATSKIFPEMIHTDLSAEEIATNNNWIQDSDTDSLSEFVQEKAHI